MMDREFLLGATPDRIPDIFARNAVDRDHLTGLLAPRPRCPLAKRMPTKTGRLLYTGGVIDERSGKETVTVRSLFLSRCEKRLDKAFGRELRKLDTAQAAEKQTEATS